MIPSVIALGSVLQVLGTGLIPLMRNYGSSFMAIVAMVGGFVTNILLDFLLVWVQGYGMKGAALATVIGQSVTALIAVCYCLYRKCFFVKVSMNHMASIVGSIFKVGLAPFGLALTPNISLVIINRFSVQYGGEKAIATYACIGYIICIIYLVLQGVGDGSQPLMSRYYGEKREDDLREVRKLAYAFAIFLALVGCILMFAGRWHVGALFGASEEVNLNTGKIIPIFLISVPFVAVTRVSTASFYATEKSVLSYILTFMIPFCIGLLAVLVLIISVWNHVTDFKTAYIQAYLFLVVMNWFDGIVLDRVWVGHSRVWVIEGMEGVPYIKSWKTVLVKRTLGTVLYLVIALAVAGIVVLIGKI